MVEQKKYYIPGFEKVKMMNLDNYYLHATGGYRGYNNQESNIQTILDNNKILTNHSIGKTSECNNSNNEICLIDATYYYKNKKQEESAFENYVLYSPTLILSKNFKTYRPIQKKHCVFSCETNLFDEVRYYGNLSLNSLKFITFPIWTDKEIKQMNLPIPFVVSSLYIFRNNISYIEKNYKDISMKNLFTGENLKEDYFNKMKIFQKR